MTVPPNGNRFWLRVGLAMLPLALAAAIAWGGLRSELQNTRAALEKKADREVVAAQNTAVLRELQGLRDDMQALRRELRRP